MTAFVLDASVALSWFFEDEFSPYAEAVSSILPRSQAVAPVIWPLEMTNALLTAIRRGRSPEAQAPSMTDAIRRLRIDIDQGTSPESLAQAALTLGLAHHISAYDTIYLELALRRNLPLATQDERLKRAASTVRVVILQR
jgi:predicted nucleic acid-binding protein